MPTKEKQPDLYTTNLGTIITIASGTRRGVRWLTRHVHGAKPSAYTGDVSIDCDHRCGVEILLGAVDAGLVLEDTHTGRRAGQ